MLSLSCCELKLKLSKDGSIRKRDVSKVEYCLRLWSGEVAKQNESDNSEEDSLSTEGSGTLVSFFVYNMRITSCGTVATPRHRFGARS